MIYSNLTVYIFQGMICMIYLVHVAGWEPHDLHRLDGVFRVEYVLDMYRSFAYIPRHVTADTGPTAADNVHYLYDLLYDLQYLQYLYDIYDL